MVVGDEVNVDSADSATPQGLQVACHLSHCGCDRGSVYVIVVTCDCRGGGHGCRCGGCGHCVVVVIVVLVVVVFDVVVNVHRTIGP